MNITARVNNAGGIHGVSVETNGAARTLVIPPKDAGSGSSVNGGELLFLALATCFCNDIYREAAKRDINVSGVEVEVTGEFGAEGEPARNVTYSAKIRGGAGEEALKDLAAATDKLAEIQNTLRSGASVTLSGIEAVSEDRR